VGEGAAASVAEAGATGARFDSDEKSNNVLELRSDCARPMRAAFWPAVVDTVRDATGDECGVPVALVDLSDVKNDVLVMLLGDGGVPTDSRRLLLLLLLLLLRSGLLLEIGTSSPSSSEPKRT
jgi:hypothetical protein